VMFLSARIPYGWVRPEIPTMYSSFQSPVRFIVTLMCASSQETYCTRLLPARATSARLAALLKVVMSASAGSGKDHRGPISNSRGYARNALRASKSTVTGHWPLATGHWPPGTQDKQITLGGWEHVGIYIKEGGRVANYLPQVAWDTINFSKDITQSQRCGVMNPNAVSA